MIQTIILFSVFTIATVYLVRKVYLDATAKDECAKGCASCDISKENSI